MTSYYRADLDRVVTHDYPGVHGAGMHQFILDEIEVGARAALALGDPEQAWWCLNADAVAAELAALNQAVS